MKKHLHLPLAVAGALLVAACGGGDDATSGQRPAASLPEDSCAQLGAGTLIEKTLGGKVATLSESVSDQDGVARAQCVWNTPAPGVSSDGATIELVVEAAPRNDLADLYDQAAALDVAPIDWRPASRIETTSADPEGDWEQAKGSDYKHPIAGAGATRQQSFRAVEGEDFVAHVVVRMDGKGAGSPAPAELANQLLDAVPALFE